jgi:hypothetical protein
MVLIMPLTCSVGEAGLGGVSTGGDGDNDRDRNRGARFDGARPIERCLSMDAATRRPACRGLSVGVLAGAPVDQVGDGVDAAA